MGVPEPISIHAPLTGCDDRGSCNSGSRRYFNPRTPRGVRRQFPNGTLPTAASFQSTHPLRGATGFIEKGNAPGCISIHAPLTGCDLRSAHQDSGTSYFNPRTPCGVRRCSFPCPSRAHTFQSTHPLRGARFSPAEFQHIAGAGHTQCPGKNAHIPGDEEVSPALGKSTVVGVFVKDRSVGGAEIFCPLVFDIDKRPLAAAELEVLQTGELEEILLGINHPIRVQVTPSGSFSSSTVTA